jgi:hypothetical protein
LHFQMERSYLLLYQQKLLKLRPHSFERHDLTLKYVSYTILLGMYLLSATLSLMLWLRPPKLNYWFGFRTAHVFEHPEKWEYA